MVGAGDTVEDRIGPRGAQGLVDGARSESMRMHSSGALQTVVLRHTQRGHTHYDWLLEPPAGLKGLKGLEGSGASGTLGTWGGWGTLGTLGPGVDEKVGGLLTFRVHVPPGAWEAVGSGGGLGLTALPMHRRYYLTGQGRVSGGRGHVMRVASGRVVYALHTADWLSLRVTWSFGVGGGNGGGTCGQVWQVRRTGGGMGSGGGDGERWRATLGSL